MPSRCRGIETSLTVAPALLKRCAASRTMASTSGSEFGQPKPSLTIPTRKPRASPVRRLVYASSTEAWWLPWIKAVRAGDRLKQQGSVGGSARDRARMIQRQLDWKHARIRNEPVGGLVTDGPAVRTGDSDRSSLIAPHRHVAFAGRDQGRAAAGGTSGRS